MSTSGNKKDDHYSLNIHREKGRILTYGPPIEYSDNDDDGENKKNEINLAFLITLENEPLSFMKYLSRLTNIMLDYHRIVHKLIQFQNSLSLLNS
jgi:hypothetical protein